MDIGEEEEKAQTAKIPLPTPKEMGKFHLSHRLCVSSFSKHAGRILAPMFLSFATACIWDSTNFKVIETNFNKEHPNTPGIWTEQTEAWKPIMKAVHDKDFHGLEIHGTHDYLIDQFLKDQVNDRT